MTERTFRLILGAWLLGALFLNSQPAMYAFMAVLLFEGVTNWRIPLLATRLRGAAPASSGGCMSLEAERVLRIVVAALLALSLYAFPTLLWWLSWFIGFALVAAGLSGICPMVLALRGLGLQ